MPVIVECSKPLEELVDKKYAKSKRHTAATRMLDSLTWASDNFMLCVERTDLGQVFVRPERALTAPPTMTALAFLRTLADLTPAKFAETITRITMHSMAKAEGEKKGKAQQRPAGKSDADGGADLLSPEAQGKLGALNARIEQAKMSRQTGSGEK